MSTFGSAPCLRDRGYSNSVAGLQIRIAGDFYQWLKRNHISIDEGSVEEHVLRYFRYRMRRKKRTGCDASAPKNFIRHLEEIGAIAKKSGPRPMTDIEIVWKTLLITCFRNWLWHHLRCDTIETSYSSFFRIIFRQTKLFVSIRSVLLMYSVL